MSALRGFIAGTIAVSTVEVLVSSPGVAGRIGSAGDLLADVIGRVVDPDVPAIGNAAFVKPDALMFDAPSSKTQTRQKSKTLRSKTLHSTKAKPPRSYAHGARRQEGTP